jgi:hypothetical protein
VLDNLGGLLSAAAVILLLLSAAWGALQRSSVTTLREQLKDSRDHEQALKDERNELRVQVETLKSENDVLRRVTTGEVHWQAISDAQDHHHQLAEKHWRETERLLHEIRDQTRRRSE